MSELIRDRYEPIRIIGQGAQGYVLLVRDTVHDRPLAIKIRRVSAGMDRDVLLGEAKILLGLRPHRGIPLVREDFFEGDRYYVAMDWVEGNSLAELLERAGAPGIAFDEVIGYIVQVAEALDHLHAHEPAIVHRDVKPSNIIVTARGDAVLVDFGISGLTAITGTPGFTAPEIAAGAQATPASDVFSLAVTAFCVLTGEMPRAGVGALRRLIPPQHADRVERAFARALSIEPARRPQKASEFARALLPVDVANNLPIWLTSFVGRDDELARIGGWVGERRLVTLTGAAGSGKTRFAVELARDRLQDHPDGAWLVELASVTDPGLVPATVAAAIGIQEQHGKDIAETLQVALEGRHSMLVLDNCEHLLDAAAQLAERLLQRCAHVRIVVTSREPLGVTGETTWRIASLSLPEDGSDLAGAERTAAVRLFLDRARAPDPDFELTPANAAAVFEICKRLDGIPLALEMAASQLRAMRVEDLASNLQDRFRILTGSRTALPRQRTLRAAMDWSYGLIGTEERALFRALGVFVGSFNGDAARALGGDGSDPLLHHLIDASLVVPHGGRYRLLEIIRQYAEEQLSEAGESDALRRAHHTYYARVAARPVSAVWGPDELDWLATIDADIDNMTSALAWGIDSDSDVGATADLAVSLAAFWRIRGLVTEGRRWTERALEKLQLDAVSRAKLLSFLGAMVLQQGDMERAESLSRDATAAARESGDEQAIIEALVLASDVGDAEAKALSREEIFDRAEGSGLPGFAALALRSKADEAFRAGDLAEGERLYRDALDVSKACGDRRGEIAAVEGLAIFAINEYRYDEARSLCEEVLVFQRSARNPRAVAQSVSMLANIAYFQRDADEARAHHLEAAAIFREIGDLDGQAGQIYGLGGLEAKDDPERARALYEEALAITTRIRQPFASGAILQSMADLAIAAGNDEEARAKYEQALAIAREQGFGGGIAITLASLARLALKEGDFTTASARGMESLARFRELGDQGGAVQALRLLAEIHRAAGDEVRARPFEEEAVALEASLP